MNVHLRPLLAALSIAALSIATLGAAPALASGPFYDQAMNCIANNASGKMWVLPADGAWHDLATTVMTARVKSDAVISGLVGLGEGNTPGMRVDYRILANGTTIGRVTKLNPPHYPHTVAISTQGESLDNRAAGGVKFKLQAKNWGTQPLYFFNATIQNVFIADRTGNSVKFTATNKPIYKNWTNVTDVVQVTIPADDDPNDGEDDPWLVILGARVTVGAGALQDELGFRFYDRTNFLGIHEFDAAVPPVLPDSHTFLRFYDPPGTGQRTMKFRLQAHKGSTAPATTASQVDFFVQVMRKYQLFTADGTNLSIAMDNADNVLLQTPDGPVAGAGESNATFNFAIASYTPGAWAQAEDDGEVRWRVKFYKNGSAADQGDGGLAWGHVNPYPHLGSLMAAGCGACGRNNHDWGVRLRAQSMCGVPGDPTPTMLPVESASVQTHWFPSEHYFAINSSCKLRTEFPDYQIVDWAGAWKRCCASWNDDCFYDCTAPALQSVNGSKGDC